MAIDTSELEQAIDAFLATLNDTRKEEYYCSDRSMAHDELYKFLDYLKPKHSAAEVAALNKRIAELEDQLKQQENML